MKKQTKKTRKKLQKLTTIIYLFALLLGYIRVSTTLSGSAHTAEGQAQAVASK